MKKWHVVPFVIVLVMLLACNRRSNQANGQDGTAEANSASSQVKKWGQSAEDISNNLKKVLIAKSDACEEAKVGLFKDVSSDDDFASMCAAASSSDRDLLKILYYTKQSVPIGKTDADLKSDFADKQVVKDVIKLFASDKISGCFASLEKCTPEQLKGIINAIVAVPCVGGYLPEGASTTTLASRRLKTATQNIRYVELAKKSVVVRLLAEDAGNLPKTAEAIFDWSGAEKITLDLPMPPLGEKDIPALKRISKGEDSLLKKAAEKELGKLEEK